MKADVAKMWTDALRSGDYRQGKYNLNSEGQFCCLGVLCEVALERGVPVDVVDTGLGFTTYGGASSSLPDVVKEWAGIWSPLGDYLGGRALFKLNDHDEATFGEIADVIDAKVEAL